MHTAYCRLQPALAHCKSKGPEGHHADLHCWVRHLPTNYTAQLALMGWFLTLTSKMTGHRIPGELPLYSTVHYTLYSARGKLHCALFNSK